jgi:ornithine--oxo-acid transaminase
VGPFEEYVTKLVLIKCLPMNTGAEAVETALKLCRKWAYEVKGIPENQIIVCENNFHGRTATIISFSNDETARKKALDHSRLDLLKFHTMMQKH